jgi:putative nucleotidyltransferase with HDIG domain
VKSDKGRTRQVEKNGRYIEELFPGLKDIESSEIREKVISVWLDAWKECEFDKIEDLSQWEPIKEKLNISNVEHTNQVVACAIAIAGVVKREQGVRIDMDTLIASAILHDVDKLLIFHPSTGKTTPMGGFLAHTAIGCHLALKAGLPLEIVHAIASHSRNYSSTPPNSAEAAILYHADHVVTETWRMSRDIEVSFDLKP